jgi:GxxExxY protein
MTANEADELLTERVIGCAIEVHRILGPGLLEAVYRDCLHVELRTAGLRVQSGARVALRYKGEIIGNDLRLDLLSNAAWSWS